MLSCQNQSYPVAAVDPVTDIVIVEDHSEVLVRWMKAGYKDMVLVNVDHHDDLRLIPENKINRLISLYKDKKWDEILRERDRGVRSLYILGDFIYAAYRLGIVKKLHWVATSGFLHYEDIEQGAVALLKAFGYSDDIISTFKKSGDAVTGTIFGLEVTISSMEGLQQIREPVLLTIDTDYFPNKMEKAQSGELAVLNDFFMQLKNKNMHVQNVSIAYSMHGDYAPVTARHIGDEIAHGFLHPEIFITHTFPELWIYRDKGFGLLRNGFYNNSLEVFIEALDIYKDEPTLLLGKAVSLAFIGKDDQAFQVMAKILLIKKEYDYAYKFIGSSLGKEEQMDRAVRYLKEYLQLHPESFHGLMSYADTLYDDGRDEEALDIYKKVLKKDEYVNAVMYAGDALFHLKRYKEALSYYEKGMSLLNEIGYRSLRDYPESARNMDLIRSMIKDQKIGDG
jgi:tetratricopeptide (TPR) repeat protein